MMRAMTAREYDDWKRFAALEPIGGSRGDTQAALIALTVAKAFGGNKEAQLHDFLLDFDRPPEEPLVDEDGNPLRKLTPEEEAEAIAMFKEQARRARETGR